MTSTGATALLAVIGVVAFNALAAVHAPPASPAAVPAIISRTGTLTVTDRGDIKEQPFLVPLGTKQLDLEFSYAPREHPVQLDIGLRAPDGLRGWSEDRSDHVHIEATSASFGYLPGPLTSGTWALLVGVANIPPGTTLRYQAHIRLSNLVDTSRAPLRPGPGWYVGDLHTHSGHSDGYRTTDTGMRRPISIAEIGSAAAQNRLDFVAITDHNTTSHWIDIDRAQAASDRLLLLPGTEVTTYRGHFNAVGLQVAPSFRIGIEQPMSRVLRETVRAGGFAAINHPWLPNDEWCMGCRWLETDAGTLAAADGVEVLNGPPEPGEPPGWRYWADLLNAGHRLVAIAGSDSHDPSDLQRPVGQPATVVYATSLSQDALVAGLKRGRVYVSAGGALGPTFDFNIISGVMTVAMGDTIRPGRVTLSASVAHASGQELLWIRRGHVIGAESIRSDQASLSHVTDAVADDWFSVIVRSRQHVTILSNAVYVDR